MLFILLVWCIIFFIFLSFGHLLSNVYNKLSNEKENYSIIELFLLGMCLTSIIVSCTSFILPSNQYIILSLVLISIIYWYFQKQKWSELHNDIYQKAKQFSSIQTLIIVLFPLILVSLNTWGSCGIDDSIYYMQAIRWNEEYPSIVGIANLEERLGFNSNLFLISSIFTFRFIENNPIYVIQTLFAALIFIWILHEITVSNFELKRIILLVLFSIFNVLFFFFHTSISTDSLPNLVLFYLISKAILYPNIQQNKPLLYILVPVYIITVKLSSAPIGSLLALYFIFYLFKNKLYKTVLTIGTISFIVTLLWCIRNILISGYLIYPVYELDLFSFDWKVPTDILIKERLYIKQSFAPLFGNFYVVQDTYHIFPYIGKYWIEYLNVTIYACSILSVLGSLICLLLKKIRKNTSSLTIWIFGSLMIAHLMWLMTAPVIRFAGGILFSTIFLFISLIIQKEKKFKLSTYYIILVLTSIFFFFGSFRLIKNNISKYPEGIIKPLSLDEKSQYQKSSVLNIPYPLNQNVTIYLSTHKWGYVYDNIPYMPGVEGEDYIWIFQSYKNVEARGDKIEDGFRYKQ